MSLAFSSTCIQNQIFGCIQTVPFPKYYVNIDSEMQKCKKCKTPFFISNDGNFHCPFCNPQQDFKPETLCFTSKQQPRKHFFFIFDISLPKSLMLTYLQQFIDNLADTSTFSIVAMSDIPIFMSIQNNILLFYLFKENQDPKPLKYYTMQKPDSSVIFSSISSIYALIPDKIKEKIDPFTILKIILKIPSVNPFVIFSFYKRPLTQISGGEAEDLSITIARSKAIVHLGLSTPDFRRSTAISRYSFGHVFTLSDNPITQMRILFSASLTPKYTIYSPRYLEISKVCGFNGKIHMENQISKLKLQQFSGGAISFGVDGSQLHRNSCVHIIEKCVFHNKKYLTLYSFTTKSAENDQKNDDITNLMVSKFLSNDILKNVWNGADIKGILQKHNKIKELNDSLMQYLGENNIQNNVMKLFYILHSSGEIEIKIRLEKIDESWKLIWPPFVYVFAKNESVDLNIDEDCKKLNWPLNVIMIKDQNDFVNILEKIKIQVPEGIKQMNY